MPGPHGSLPELFFVHYPGRRSHFSEGHHPFAAKCTKLIFLDFSGSDFIFVSTRISYFPPSPLLHCTALSCNAWSIIVQRKCGFDPNYNSVLFLLSLFLWNFVWMYKTGYGFCLARRFDRVLLCCCSQNLVLYHIY